MCGYVFPDFSDEVLLPLEVLHVLVVMLPGVIVPTLERSAQLSIGSGIPIELFDYRLFGVCSEASLWFGIVWVEMRPYSFVGRCLDLCDPLLPVIWSSQDDIL